MTGLALVLVLLSLSSAWRPSWMPPINDEDCTFTREDSYNSLVRRVDVNPKDQKISRTEIDEAIVKYAPYWIRALSWFVSVNGILDACDANKDGFVTRQDWLATDKTCLPLKKNWCLIQWFDNRANDIDAANN